MSGIPQGCFLTWGQSSRSGRCIPLSGLSSGSRLSGEAGDGTLSSFGRLVHLRCEAPEVPGSPLGGGSGHSSFCLENGLGSRQRGASVQVAISQQVLWRPKCGCARTDCSWHRRAGVAWAAASAAERLMQQTLSLHVSGGRRSEVRVPVIQVLVCRETVSSYGRGMSSGVFS